MSLISYTKITDGSTIDASDVNNPLDTIYNDYNGGINSSNIADGAISGSKITDATVAFAKLAAEVVKSAIIGSSGGTQLGPNSTTYVSLFGNFTSSYQLPVPFAGTIKNLYVVLEGSPGVTESFTCTLMKENVAQALTCTIMNANKGSDTTHSFAVAAGDRLSLKVVRSLNATPNTLNWCVEYDATV